MAYTLSEQNLERQRLVGKWLAPFTDNLLDILKLPSGIRCLDLGCGIGESTRHLARRMDHSSEVIGLDLNPDLIAAAREIPSPEGAKVAFHQGDASTKLEFEDQSFDFVFARFLLIHLPDPEAALEEMLRVCKSGGIVAVLEPDFAMQLCYPRSWAWERIPDLWGKLFADAFLGRKLWSLFHQAGYPSANIVVNSPLELEGNEMKRLYRMTVEASGPAFIEKGIIGEQEFQEMCEEFKRVERAEKVLCLGCYLFTGWVVRR